MDLEARIRLFARDLTRRLLGYEPAKDSSIGLAFRDVIEKATRELLREIMEENTDAVR